MTRYLVFLLLPLFLWTCDPAEDDDGALQADSFDRAAMLAHWADNVIIPAHSDFSIASSRQKLVAMQYEANPDPVFLDSLRAAYTAAYLSWQRLAPHVTGPGELVRLREQINVYPTDTARLLTALDADLDLPSNVDIQGFAAIDYLLFGVADPAVHRKLLLKLVLRVDDLQSDAYLNWRSFDNRDNYVNNSGNSATASVDRTVNDFIFWYERNLRAGKVGIPAGVFSSSPRPELTEAYYRGDLSKALFMDGLDAAIDFFNEEQGLKTYLDALDVRRDGSLLSTRINDNFTAARGIAVTLDDDFAEQIRTDNTAMLRLHDALQANVILLKVDMLQALGINVDFVDADGD